MFPVLFTAHGSPMLALEDSKATRKLKELGEYIIDKYNKPEAILMISAHWYTNNSYTSDYEKPKQIYDMYGFPRELYEVKYEPLGSSELANEVIRATDNMVSINNEWGIDHGSWTVLCHMFSSADIPVVQLSVNAALSEEESFALGRKLISLREKYLIIGSGNIVHNLRIVSWDMEDGTKEADEFDDYIKDSVLEKDFNKVVNYKEHKYSKYAVPTNDHFLPLLYILGLVREEDKISVFNNFRNLGSISMTSFLIE